jgi:hypothetical protein
MSAPRRALALLAAAVLGLAAQPIAPAPVGADSLPADWIPADSEKDWSVAFARFQGVDLSPEQEYLTHSLPLLLRERVSAVHTHFFGEEERAGYRRWILDQEKRRLGQTLQQLREERDELLFRDLTPSARNQQLADVDERIREAVERLNAVSAADPELVPFPDRKPIRFVQAGAGSEAGPAAGANLAVANLAGGEATDPLVETSVLSPLRVARHEQVNLLVWGTLEEIQGYLYLEVRAVDAHLGRETFYFRDAAEPEELAARLETASAELSRTLWGRDWASLAVETIPPDARVFVDGAYVGRAPVEVDYLVPGSVEIRAEAPGFRVELLRVDLPPFVQTQAAIVLERQAESPLLLSSQPPGASVYEGATWLGTTPLSVPRPESPSRFLLRLQGYPEQVLYLGPQSEDSVSVTFEAGRPEPGELQAKRRNSFYTAFGVFAASVPLPFFLWAAANDSYAAFQEAASGAEAERLAGQVRAFYGGYAATLGVSVALFVNMMVYLLRYIRAADRQG